MKRLLALSALALLTACSASPEQAVSNGAATTTQPVLLPLAIGSAKGAHRFDVEVARTPQEQARGLMFRKAIDADSGMLFPMAPPRTASFWMENTVIPLDMLFIRTDGTIAFIGANEAPYSRIPVSAGIPVAAVLELRGGRAAELGIREGDVVLWGQCAAPDTKPDAKRAIDLNFCPASAR